MDSNFIEIFTKKQFFQEKNIITYDMAVSLTFFVNAKGF